MWILQTDTDIITGDLELIAAHLLEGLRPPLTPRQVELLAEVVTGAPGRMTRLEAPGAAG